MAGPSNEALVDNMSTAFGTLAAKIAEISGALQDSDTNGQIRHLANFIQPLLKAPNIEIHQIESMPEPFNDLHRISSLPPIEAVEAQRFEYDTAEFDFEMNIGSHTEDKSETGVNAKTEAGVSGGWGPVSAHASMSCEVTHKSEQTRTTDMTAKISMNLKMKRGALPEGLAKAIDQASEFSRMANEARMMIYGAQVEVMKQKALSDSKAVEQAGESAAKAIEADGSGEQAPDGGGDAGGGGE